MSAGPSPREKFVSFVGTHTSLVAGGAFTAFIALRVLAIADYDTVTAFAVLQNVGVGSVLLAMTITVIPAVAAVLAAVFAATATFAVAWRRKLVYAALVLSTFAGAAAPVSIVVTMAASVAVIWVRERTRVGASSSVSSVMRWVSKALNAVTPLVLVGAVLMLVMNRQAWLAPEIVTDEDGAVLVGFVLSDGQRPVLMELKSRNVVYLDGALKHRQVCQPAPSWLGGRNLLSFTDRGPYAYPSCDLPDK